MRIGLLMFAALACLLGGAAGCGDRANVAEACTAPDVGCDDDLVCETAVPGGYCTKACATLGSGADCPEGSVCEDVSGAGTLRCARICRGPSDCRPGITCGGGTVSGAQVCRAG